MTIPTSSTSAPGSRRRRPIPGVTLPELIIGLGVFGLFTLMVAQGVVMAYGNYGRDTEEVNAVRGASSGLDLLGRELRACTQVYVPDPTATNPTLPGFLEGQTYAPGNAGNPPFTFRHFDNASSQDIVVAYQAIGSSMQRFLYDPGFDPNKPSTQVVLKDPTGAPIPPVTLAPDVSSFTLTRLARAQTNGALFLQMDLVTRQVSGTFPMETQVRIEGLAPGI